MISLNNGLIERLLYLLFVAIICVWIHFVRNGTFIRCYMCWFFGGLEVMFLFELLYEYYISLFIPFNLNL